MVGLKLLLVLAIIAPAFSKGVIKGGFYKIESVTDSSALTATWTGQPREVNTEEWREMAVQEWRVRPTSNQGKVKYILRNEYVKNNEVNKEIIPGATTGGKPDYEISEWDFIPVVGAKDTFLLNKAEGCLTSNGRDKRISINLCNPSAKNQQWHFVFLFEHTKQEQ